MNKEVIKAINKKDTSYIKIRKWWRKNGYKINRVILFPLWFMILAKDKINSYLDSKQTWNENRANNILNYYVPRYAKWYEEEEEFYFFDNGWGWEMCCAKEILKRKDRRFWKCNTNTIRRYLIDTFELDGFTKQILTDDNWTELIFKLNK